MSILVTFEEFSPSNTFSGVPAIDASPAMHCGEPMELVVPAVMPLAGDYTFEPEEGGPVHLPPVWRCGCGFQLDAAAGAAPGPDALLEVPFEAALCA